MISFRARDNRHDPNPADQADRPGRSARRLGLPLIALIGLALLAAIRVVLHDLDIISEGTAINALFVFGPLLVWIVIALWAKVPNPFLTLLTVGGVLRNSPPVSRLHTLSGPESESADSHLGGKTPEPTVRNARPALRGTEGCVSVRGLRG